MQIQRLDIPDVIVVTPRRFEDDRGFFSETYNEKAFAEAGIDAAFVQDNHSCSVQAGTVRGLHYQTPPHAQGKLVRVVSGAVYDVVVDLRRSSPSFGQWFGPELRADLHNMLWMPPGCAHGFLVLSETADFLYKTSDYYHPESEVSLRWDDPTVGIEWPLQGEPLLSGKDAAGLSWDEIPFFD